MTSSITSSISLPILGFAMVAGVGLIPAIVAEEKGRPFGWWWLYGALFFPLALPHAILAEDAPRFVRRYRALPDATSQSWESYFGPESATGEPDPEISWDDLRMQQAGEYSGTPSRSPTPSSKSTKSNQESRERQTQSPSNGNLGPAGWKFDDRDIHVRRDLDPPIWSDRDYRGIRFPFISIVSVLALTMLVTAGAYEIAAGGWPAVSQQIAAIGTEIERSVLARFDAAGSPPSVATSPGTKPGMNDATSFPLPKPASMPPITPVAAVAPAAGPSPAALPQLAAIPPQLPQQSETVPAEPPPVAEKSAPKPVGGDAVAAPDSEPAGKLQPVAVSRDVVKHVQKSLRALGYAPGHIDGKVGAETRDAIRLYQTHAGLTVTGVIDRQLLRSLGVKIYANRD